MCFIPDTFRLSQEVDRHPANAALPPLSGEAFDELCRSIKRHGQREPIILAFGQIIDGWHRYKACCELRIAPRCIAPFDAFIEPEMYTDIEATLDVCRLNPRMAAPKAPQGQLALF